MSFNSRREKATSLATLLRIRLSVSWVRRSPSNRNGVLEPKVDLDVSVVSVGSLIEFDPVDEELHRHRPLHPGFAVIVLIGHPQIPEGLEDQGVDSCASLRPIFDLFPR